MAMGRSMMKKEQKMLCHNGDGNEFGDHKLKSTSAIIGHLVASIPSGQS